MIKIKFDFNREQEKTNKLNEIINKNEHHVIQYQINLN